MKAERSKRETCYVCHGKIDGDPVEVGPEVYRHKRCAPGTERWAEATRAGLSEMSRKDRERARWWLRAFGFETRGGRRGAEE